MACETPGPVGNHFGRQANRRPEAVAGGSTHPATAPGPPGIGKDGCMDALLIMAGAFFGFIVAYKSYGRFVGRKIFALSGGAPVPSRELEDGIDYVPTRKEVIFGHHFASIAGTGPIVGPAIAVIWGWVPALIWVIAGSVVMGAVHDFGSLVISMRNQGKSLAEFSARYVNGRIKVLFFVIVFLELLLVIAIFGLVIAVIFKMYPGAVFPVWMQIPIAIFLGHLIYKRGANITIWSVTTVAAMYATIVIGFFLPIEMPAVAGIPATGVWTVILLAYAFVASVLPVTTLLQPRDYINAHQLLIALALLVFGILVSGLTGQLHVVAPAVNASPAGAPPMWPFLFITIACGAISGFHSLVSSGTSSKQVRSEDDALFVGYGAMLTEGMLATLVIIATCAGIGMGSLARGGDSVAGIAAWTDHYASWAAASGLASKVGAFVEGAANMMESAGLPHGVAVIIMGVFVASFAGTTLDTATRIQRYVIAELAGDLKLEVLTGRYTATFIAVGTAMVLAFITGASGNGALILWPLFGATNQTLAALALIVAAVYLKTKGGLKWLVAGVPALFMIVMTVWALAVNQTTFLADRNAILIVMNCIILLAALWIAVEGFVAFLGADSVTAGEPGTAAVS